MKVMVRYCRHMRRDGSYNTVVFDDETKTIADFAPPENCAFVEARLSGDVDALKKTLLENGYRKERHT